MPPLCCFVFCLLLLASVSNLSRNSALAGSGREGKLTGPEINVTKHFSFPDFNSVSNPRVLHEVKLLGSAKLSLEQGTVQIPDVSGAVDLRHLAGRALYSFPVRLLDPVTNTPASFETTFSFQFKKDTSVVPIGDGDSVGVHAGSGLTFIMVPDEFTVGRSGPWLGMLNDACNERYKAVGVEFDTHHNPEFGDPNDNHIGINLGSIVSVKTINASDHGVFFKDGFCHQARIRYDGVKRWMDIHLGSFGKELPSEPAFSGPLDLSNFLEEYMFVGFSASTGNLTQIHNVISWNFTSMSRAFLRVPSADSCEAKIILPSSHATGYAKNKPSSKFFIFVAVVVLVLVVIASLFYRRKHKDNQSSITIFPEKIKRPTPPNKPRQFTISELSSATRGFGEDEVLGYDSRGTFYQGKLLNGCQVALKRFSSEFLNANGLDRRLIMKEIGVISRARHPNLVPVRGWCRDKGAIIVVYEFFTNGSLDKWLFGAGVLPWTRRLKIIKDTAEALSFLHLKKLAHKNMKTSSVLLDLTFRAVLGDFGLVLTGSESKRFEAAVSQAVDVFEFGIFVLEVIAGRKRLGPDVRRNQTDLLDLAWRMHEIDEKAKAIDRRMGSLVNVEQAIRALEIGLLCTLNESKGRPNMDQVAELLCTDVPVPELPSSRPMSLFPYSSSTGLCAGYSCAPLRKEAKEAPLIDLSEPAAEEEEKKEEDKAEGAEALAVAAPSS